MKVLCNLATFLVLVKAVLCQKDPHFVDDRNTIVHMFEWKWQDIASECENFLSKKKFGGVQISPPNENVIITDRPWYERYQPVSYVLTTRSGDENSLADMIKRCNKVGIRIYIDVLLNDMAGVSGKGTAGNSADVENKNYPAVPYSAGNFHQSCDIDYNNATSIRVCELAGLKDLDQSQDYVRQKMITYLNRLIQLGAAGFRVDAAKHIFPKDLEYIFGKLNSLNSDHGFGSGARAFIYQEVVDLGVDAVSNTEYTGFGRVVEFKAGNELGNSFQGHNPLTYLSNWGTGWGFVKGADALIMTDNHDSQRTGGDNIVTYKKPKPYKAANAFILAHPYDAVTRVMSSYAFGNKDQGPPNTNGQITSPGFSGGTCTNGWICEYRWRQIFNMVEFRSVVGNTSIVHWWTNGQNQIAFGRNGKGFAAFTVGGDINKTLSTGLSAGSYCDVISGSLENSRCTGKKVVVDGNGNAHISLAEREDDAALAIHVNAKL